VAIPLANPLTPREETRESVQPSAWRAPRGLHLWHLASLDAPTVAVVWALAFAWMADVHLGTWIPLLLACGTWAVYVSDRLLDAYRAIRLSKLDTLRERHYFHWLHRRLLLPAACAAAAIAAALVMRCTSFAVRNRDSVLAAAALVYFSGVHSPARLPNWLRRLVSKELMVGLLFAAGCAAPTLSRLHSADWQVFACLGLFAALAWINCSAIENWESSHQEAAVLRHASALCVVAFAVSGASAFTNPRASALACAVGISALLLSLLDRRRGRLSPLTLRTVADLVLLTPLIIPMIPGARLG